MSGWSGRWCGIGIVLGLVSACAHDPSEAALRSTLEAMEAAAEARDVSAFMEYVSADFGGESVAADRDALRRYLVGISLQNRSIGVTRTATEIRLYGDRATARVDLLLTGSSGWIPERGRVLRAETGWRYEDGRWRLLSARWEEGRDGP